LTLEFGMESIFSDGIPVGTDLADDGDQVSVL
jgi:hypothetical protein